PRVLNCMIYKISFMEDYIINVGKVEEWQTIKDITALDEVFQRAKRTLIGGGTVALVREQRNGDSYRFEEFTNLEDFEHYKKNVYKYLDV
ncbi:MAG TPA: hypothetical protein VG605_19760, partial [Puia sp.]|nr:hypothetical protein [Puia sp.]